MLFLDDNSDPYSGPVVTCNIHVLQDSEPTGLIHTIVHNARLGTLYYYPVSGVYSGKLGVPIKEQGTHSAQVIGSIRHLVVGVSTPICRLLYTDIGYYMQVHPGNAPFAGYIQPDAYTLGIQDEDPFYYAETIATGFIQQSTGAVEQVEVTLALSIRSGIVGWMQF